MCTDRDAVLIVVAERLCGRLSVEQLNVDTHVCVLDITCFEEFCFGSVDCRGFRHMENIVVMYGLSTYN